MLTQAAFTSPSASPSTPSPSSLVRHGDEDLSARGQLHAGRDRWRPWRTPTQSPYQCPSPRRWTSSRGQAGCRSLRGEGADGEGGGGFGIAAIPPSVYIMYRKMGDCGYLEGGVLDDHIQTLERMRTIEQINHPHPHNGSCLEVGINQSQLYCLDCLLSFLLLRK